MNWEKVCLDAVYVAIETGKFIRNESALITIDQAKSKGLHDFVTHVDKGSEQRLVDGLSKILPEASFLTEEGTISDSGNELRWIIDPLDGTTNFIHRLPPYAISIGLQRGDDLIAGIVYEITLDECFYAWENSAAFLNKKEIHVSKVVEIKDTFIATGFPYHAFGRMDEFMQSLDYFFKYSPGVRRLGSAATDLAYVACGRFDAFYEYNLNPWDVAGGAFIIQQAGGKSSDFKGGNDFVFGREIVSTNGAAHTNFLNAVAKFMNK